MIDPYAIDGHKIHYHIDRLNQWQTDPQNTFPIYIEISPVGHCNHRCTFCAVDYIGYKTRTLDTDTLIRTLQDMAKYGVRSVMFAGEGEPLLHPQLPLIINEAHKVGLAIAITTNGTPLTQKFVDACLHSISWIKVSMNGGSRSYRDIHKAGEKDYERVWANLQYAKSKVTGSTVLGIQSLLLPENFEDIEELAIRGLRMRLDYLVIKPYSQHLSSLTTKYKDIQYMDKYKSKLDYLQYWYAKEGFAIVAREKAMESWDSQDRGYSTCYSTPYFWAYLMASGDLYGCSAYLLDDRFNYGNILTQSFHDIWLGIKRKESMEYVLKTLDIKECRKNCRMDKVNRFLNDIKHPNSHANFI